MFKISLRLFNLTDLVHLSNRFISPFECVVVRNVKGNVDTFSKGFALIEVQKISETSVHCITLKFLHWKSTCIVISDESSLKFFARSIILGLIDLGHCYTEITVILIIRRCSKTFTTKFIHLSSF